MTHPAKRSIRTVFGLLLAAALACGGASFATACGSDEGGAPLDGSDSGTGGSDAGGGPSPANNPPVPREQFKARVIDALCSTIQPCCAAAGLDYVAGACAAKLDGANAGLSIDISQLDNPALTYDAQAAGDCIAVLRTVNNLCTRASTRGGIELVQAFGSTSTQSAFGCNTMLSGTKQLGEACTKYECAPGAGGRVVSCDVDVTSDAGTGVCREVELVALGAACDADPQAIAGQTIRLCDPGTLSANDFSDLEPYLAAAPTCDSKTGTCKRGSEIYRAVGASCADGACVRSAYCGTNQICAPRADVGQSCAAAQCATYARCENQTCVAEKGDGEPCTSANECLGECNARKVCAPRSTVASPELCSGG